MISKIERINKSCTRGKNWVCHTYIRLKFFRLDLTVWNKKIALCGGGGGGWIEGSLAIHFMSLWKNQLNSVTKQLQCKVQVFLISSTDKYQDALLLVLQNAPIGSKNQAVKVRTFLHLAHESI